MALTDCITHTGKLNRLGYPCNSHNLWRLMFGEIPEGLELVTHKENMRRAFMRQIRCKNGHLKLIENCYVSPRGIVCCLTCIQEQGRRSYSENKEARKKHQRDYYHRTYVRLPKEERSRIARENALKGRRK